MKTPDYAASFHALLPSAAACPDLLERVDSVATSRLPVFRNVTGQVSPDPSNSHFTDPLVPVPADLATLPIMQAAGVPGAHELILRRSLLERLDAARALLPRGIDLVVLDCWRTRAVHEQLDSWRQEMPPRLIDDRPYYAHASGGAVDVTFSWNGQPVAVGSRYYSGDPTAHLYAYEGAGGPLRPLRRLMAAVLLGAGFAPSGACWWHWEYGTPRWAAWYGEEPRYGLVTRLTR